MANGYPITDAPEYDEQNPYANRDPRLALYIVVNGTEMGTDKRLLILVPTIHLTMTV